MKVGFGSMAVDDDTPDDLEEYGQDEVEDFEDRIAAGATAAETAEQLRLEVATLRSLEAMALGVLHSGRDTKWSELDRILDDALMIDAAGNRRKLIVFTEPKDTLHYLVRKIRARLGNPDAVAAIHGGVKREERRKVVERFMTDRGLLVLVANDAAGEGVNLQRGHLMVNYDLPWNPNRIEQRFGRIHRIGQTEVCHLWNLVAADTREGAVYARLLEKLEAAREALGGRVYDVLGELFEGTALKDLLFEAIRYGEREDVKARLFRQVDGAVDHEHLMQLLQRRALTNDSMPEARVEALRLEMERAEAQRLQPCHVQSFFVEAFRHLGGHIRRREEGRWEITHVPAVLRERDRRIGTGAAIRRRYERICFEKGHIDRQPVAAFICPGHPLLEAVIGVVREKYGHLMTQGAVLVDETDLGEEPSAVVLLEHGVRDGRTTATGQAAHRLREAPVCRDRQGRPGTGCGDRAASQPAAGASRGGRSSRRPGYRDVAARRHRTSRHRVRHGGACAGACRRGQGAAPAGDREGRAGGARPAEEGDQLLGRSGLRAEGAGTRREEDPPQLAERRSARGGPGRAVAAAHRAAREGEVHLVPAAPGAWRDARDPARPDRGAGAGER